MKQGSFMQRLRRDQTGNVMYLTAGLLFPTIALVGTGIDLGQAYMAKSRLQQACDAGVLAGRREMDQTLTTASFTSVGKPAAQRMFDFNFPTGVHGSQNVTFSTSQPAGSPSAISGSATAQVKTVLMHMFGTETIDVSADCETRLEQANADVMFVFDVTGSMVSNQMLNSTNTLVTRLRVLQDSANQFVDQLTASSINNGKIRLGMVNYNTSVNVGNILRTDHNNLLSETTEHPSRGLLYIQVNRTVPTSGWSNITSDTAATNANTKTKCETLTDLGFRIVTTIGAVTENGSGTASFRPYNAGYTANYRRYEWSSSKCQLQSADRTLTSPALLLLQGTSRPTDTTYLFAGYGYFNREFPTGNLAVNSSVSFPLNNSGNNPANRSSQWRGCVIEPIDNVDINHIPNSQSSGWQRILQDISFQRPDADTQWTTASNAVAGNSCPSESRTLAEYNSSNKSTFQGYINNLIASGNTYHDAGMIWGARLLSQKGIRSSFNQNNADRYIVFMTDGEMFTNTNQTTYMGVEQIENRVGGSGTRLNELHIERFLEACRQARAEGITIWTIAFGTTLASNPHLTTCANAGQALEAGDQASLILAFAKIKASIARLRLSQ
jgi:Flp pilus assembly protein TadG